MGSIDFNNINKLSYLLHNSSNYELHKIVIETMGIDCILSTKHNGLISNILNYLIEIKNDILIESILVSDINLMKRDYLKLIKYYFEKDKDRALNIFEKKVLTKQNKNTESILLFKDIDFILKNNIGQILEKTIGLFTESTLDGYELVTPEKINIFYLPELLIHNIKNKIEETYLQKQLNNLNKFWNQWKKPYKAIIDGGSVIHNRNGLIVEESYLDLINLIQIVSEQIGKPLVILHQKHLKKRPQLLKELNTTSYLTPYNYNDDLFILWFFLKLGTKPFIISNDKYRDHVFNFETLFISKDRKKEMGFFQFNNIIKQQILRYDIDKKYIEAQPRYSKCIQLIENHLYVPHKTNQFIKIY